MDCSECVRLDHERARLEGMIVTKLKLASANAARKGDSEEYLMLRAAANEARIGLQTVDSQIAQHQANHKTLAASGAS